MNTPATEENGRVIAVRGGQMMDDINHWCGENLSKDEFDLTWYFVGDRMMFFFSFAKSEDAVLCRLSV